MGSCHCCVVINIGVTLYSVFRTYAPGNAEDPIHEQILQSRKSWSTSIDCSHLEQSLDTGGLRPMRKKCQGSELFSSSDFAQRSLDTDPN
jgi:hypothetical protein